MRYSLSRVAYAVAARLHDVYLARRGPRAVDVVDGHHPDSGPQPIAARQLRGDLNAPVFDAMTVDRREPRAHDGVDYGA